MADPADGRYLELAHEIASQPIHVDNMLKLFENRLRKEPQSKDYFRRSSAQAIGHQQQYWTAHLGEGLAEGLFKLIKGKAEAGAADAAPTKRELAERIREAVDEYVTDIVEQTI